jgi:hypothetical protein
VFSAELMVVNCDLLCYAEPVVVSHSELCCASSFKSLCVMLIQWL